MSFSEVQDYSVKPKQLGETFNDTEDTFFGQMRRDLRGYVQSALIGIVRPYVAREMPGWCHAYRLAIGGSWRDHFWRSAPQRFSRGKIHHYVLRYSLAHWFEREAYFLKRWPDLSTQIFMRDVIRQGETIVDVGAHRGMFTLLASYLCGSNGTVISVEPNHQVRMRLERDIAHNGIENVEVAAFAAGDKHASGVLYVPQDDSFAASFSACENALQMEVKCVPLDDTLEGRLPSLIKISAEGFEAETLKGLSKTLHACHPVLITDISDRRLRKCGSSALELVSTLVKFGYLGFKIMPHEQTETADWAIRPISPKDDEIRAIWVHPGSPIDARETILKRITIS